MRARLLKKEKLDSFLKKISKNYTVVAPVQKDILRFDKITEAKEISFEGHPLFPLKKYYYENRTLFSYNDNRIRENKNTNKYAILGAKLCDINALLKVDKLFIDDTEDSYYKKSRENNLLIGFNCEKAPKETCFCESMKLKDIGYDLFFCDEGDSYHIKIGSKKGEELVKSLPTSDRIPAMITTKKKLKNFDIKNSFNDSEWTKEVKACISCGACTNLCPTCMCFDVNDDPNPDLVTGKRNLTWDSCQFKDFTKVAGGHSFRDSRESRFKHRIFHKLEYFKERFDETMCTGCGRCIEGCPTKIDFVKIVNSMK